MAYIYPVSHCNTIPHAYAEAHADPATYINSAADAGTHADPATRDSLRLRQHRGGPHLRGEEQRFRRLLGLG